jgi:hypothetical protein
MLRQRVLQELRDAVAAERAEARETCTVRLTAARGIGDQIKRVRATLEAERAFQRDMRRIESANRQRARQVHRASAAERRSESDDSVRANIGPEFWALFDRVKGSIKASPRMSRTEAFLAYVESHADEYVEALESRTDALVREMEERQAAPAPHERWHSPADSHPEVGPSSRAADSVPF